MSMLGKRLREAREKKGLKQLEASKKLGISNGTLSGYERNYRDPDTTILEKMAELYDVDTDWLLGRTSYIKKENPDEIILRELIAKYNINLKDPSTRHKIEKIIQIVLDDTLLK
jgi:transcriptional regulator with XRE-family HTH domain